MTKALRFIAALLFALPLCAQAQRLYSQPELDQMLAPVALYPDPLLSQLLMAATYPDEVRQAAAWSRANPGLQGDEAVRAVQHEDWDASVKSLAAFPQILQRMAENPQWMQSLGEAFLAQEPHVMDAVQQLRRRAQAAGNLQSSEHLYVQQQGPTIVIQPASAQYVYVPYYDPLVVYGSWWWPAYRPVYWAPWPGYARHHGPGVSAGFLWGRPVSLPMNFFGYANRQHRHVRAAHPNGSHHRQAFEANRGVAVAPQPPRQELAPQPRRHELAPQPRHHELAPQPWRHESQRRAAFAERRAVPAAAPVQLQPQVRAAAPAAAPAPRIQESTAAQPQVRMPAAVAPPQSRAAREEPRREHRGEPRNHHAPRGRERS